ncbi:hypothetical protein H5410_035659 [Solanum commersonii]|uniref:HECT-type E3 ubiquitin transferase n=1 Tax=Solanum commersonii TaxID=4109 RepID=A0A9J5Y1B0_SOLCO|nr:hypothetical protein H5410_035659 [Solanum commersonii]
MPAGKKKVFLFFWTLIRYLPLESFRYLDSRLCISRTSESCQHLPSEQTCFYQLCIPTYCDRVVMQNRLDIVTQEHIGCIYVKDEDNRKKSSLWSRKQIGDVHQNTIEWKIKLLSLEEIDIQVNTIQSRQDVNKAHVEYIHRMKLQESIRLQKSQCRWFEEGLHGYDGTFFQSYWDIIKEDIIAYVQDFLEGKTDQVLSRSLNDLNDHNRFIPFSMPPNCPNIKHLDYADDIVIFSNGNTPYMRLIMNWIKVYESSSG